jgi:hypothetical protein
MDANTWMELLVTGAPQALVPLCETARGAGSQDEPSSAPVQEPP